jgi:hypothetical protein
MVLSPSGLFPGAPSRPRFAGRCPRDPTRPCQRPSVDASPSIPGALIGRSRGGPGCNRRGPSGTRSCDRLTSWRLSGDSRHRARRGSWTGRPASPGGGPRPRGAVWSSLTPSDISWTVSDRDPKIVKSQLSMFISVAIPTRWSVYQPWSAASDGRDGRVIRCTSGSSYFFPPHGRLLTFREPGRQVPAVTGKILPQPNAPWSPILARGRACSKGTKLHLFLAYDQITGEPSVLAQIMPKRLGGGTDSGMGPSRAIHEACRPHDNPRTGLDWSPLGQSTGRPSARGCPGGSRSVPWVALVRQHQHGSPPSRSGGGGSRRGG